MIADPAAPGPPDDPAPRDDSQENRVSQYPPEQSPSGWGNQGGNGAPAPGYGAGETPTYQAPPFGPPGGQQYGPGGYGPGGYGPPPGGYGAPQEPGFGYGQQPGPPQPPFPGGYPAYYPGGFGPPVQQIPNYLTLNIVLLIVSILMCGLFALPSGITGVVFSNKVRSRQLTGDIQGALSASKIAKIMAIVTAAIMVLAIVLIAVLVARGWHGTSGQVGGNGTF
jgi:hypothetical protein